jgi:hypothetical protein
METIGFIGSYDKTDLIIYIAKVLTIAGKKVLVIDDTIEQKAKYIVPVINPTKAYVTEFEKIDISVGFDNFEEIEKYLGIPEGKELDYDICLIDIDSTKNFENFNMKKSKKNYFVTSFDLYSLKRGLEIINDLKEPITLTKIIYSKDILKEDNEYLNYISLGTKAIWNEDYILYMPIDNGDQSIIIENQRISKIGIKRLSSQYKDGLRYIAIDILGEKKESEVKKAFRILEKEV